MTPPSAGLPAAFTFDGHGSAPAAARCATSGSTGATAARQSLGALTGKQTVTHVYSSDGTYTISATVTDAAGNTSSVSTSVSVIPVQRPSVSVTAVPQTAVVGGTINFTIQITAAPGMGIVRTSINFGAGRGDAPTRRQHLDHRSEAVHLALAPRLVTVTVVDTTGATTEGTTTVSITP